MRSLLSSLLVLLCMTRLCLSQGPDCGELNVQFTGQAFAGTDLPQCVTSALQCCSADYLRAREAAARETFREALEDQLEDTAEKFDNLVERIRNYFMTDFSTFLVNHLPGRNLPVISIPDSVIRELEEEVDEAFQDVDSFDPAQLTEDFNRILAQALFNGTAQGDQNKVDCVINLIRDNTRADVQANITATLRRFQRILQSLVKIARFLENFEDSLEKFEPLKECVDELIRRSICGRCTRNIPPLCTNVCGALVRVCLSPVFTGLRDEFNALWRYIRNLYNLVQMDLRNLFTQFEKNFIDLSGVFFGLNSCGISLGQRKRRQDDSEERLPPEVFTAAERLMNSGIFEYGVNGPRFCTAQQRPREECNENVDLRACRNGSFCTANCRCWNGEQELENDIEQFTGTDITEQANNPVLKVSQDVLESSARSLGTPVNDFLTSSSFMDTAPAGVEIPPAEPYDDGSVSLHTGTALLSLLVPALLTLCLN